MAASTKSLQFISETVSYKLSVNIVIQTSILFIETGFETMSKLNFRVCQNDPS